MDKNQIKKMDERKVTELVRSMMKIYLKESGKYSVDEINQRLDENIKRVILKPRNGEVLGDASLDEPEIIIYGVDNKVPTFREIIFNLDYYRATILHEGEHKFFTHKSENDTILGSALLRLIYRDKNFREWLKKDVKKSDINQIKKFIPDANELKRKQVNKEIFDREIGRGISEGFIEWYRVEVLGNKDNVSYENLTSVIYKLQRYLDDKGFDGTSVIAKYGDSDYDYVFDTLNMSKATGIAFIRILDNMYYLLEKKKLDKMDEIIRYFELEESNSLQSDFISRYGKVISGLDIFNKLQEEYKKIPYRKETFKEFVARKSNDLASAISKYEKLLNDFLSKALEKKETSQVMLELPDISDLINRAAILSAQNMDDIIEGMEISFKKHREEENSKNIWNKKGKYEIRKVPTGIKIEKSIENDTDENSLLNKEQVISDCEDLEGNVLAEVQEDEQQENEILSETELKYIQPLEAENDELQIPFNIISATNHIVKTIKYNTKCAIQDIASDIKIKRNFRQMIKENRKEARRYYDNSGKLAFVAMAAAAGISVGALIAYLKGDLKNIQDFLNITPTTQEDNKLMHVIEIEIPKKPIQPPIIESETPPPSPSQEDNLPFFNDNGTINLKLGSTIYKSSDKNGGKTTLKYDYENLIIDSVRLMQNNNVIDSGDLSNLKGFINNLGEEDLSIMMRLAVEQNGEKVCIAWCDYAEMLENAKNAENVEDIEK